MNDIKCWEKNIKIEHEIKKKDKEILLNQIDAVKHRLKQLENIECQERIDLAHKLRILRRQRDEVMK